MAKTRGLIEALRGAQEDVSKTTSQMVATIREQHQELPSDYGEQLGSAIEKYGQSVADFLRAIGDQAAALGESHRADSLAVAENIVKVSQLEAERTKAFIHRMKELGGAMAVAKKNFETAIGHPINNADNQPVELDMKAMEQAVNPK
jgi:hypothetical protein